MTAASTPVTWDTVVQPLIDANERLGRAWGQTAHLNAVVNTPALREAYNTALPRITQYWTEIGQNQALYERYKARSAAPADFVLVRSAQPDGGDPCRSGIHMYHRAEEEVAKILDDFIGRHTSPPAATR